jgi:multiple sugar transport system substrate-binding protein
MLKKALLVLAVLVLGTLILVGCGPKDTVEDVDLGGTTITYWHVYGEGDPRNEAITAIVDDFNATNEDGITVEALDQGQYGDVEDKVNAGIQSGDLPNVVQAYTSALLNWDSVDMVVDLQPFFLDPTYGLTEEEIDDVYPSVLDLGVTSDGARISWALSQSANVLVYNYTWAQELGFDSAPSSPEELKAQLCAAAAANAADDNPDNDGTGGIVWYPSASNIVTFVHAFGGDFLNDDGTAYDFATDEVKAAAMYINELRDGGCTFTTESYPNPEQATRKALITLSSSSGLKYYGYAFSDAENDDTWGFFPAPGPDGKQGVDSFTQAVGVMKSSPEKEAASWVFIKYLTSAANQATWIEGSGYFPTHFSTEDLLADYIANDPIYAAGFSAVSQLAQGEPETFTAWNSVRRALGDAAAELFVAETAAEIDAILEALNVTAADLVAEIEE